MEQRVPSLDQDTPELACAYAQACRHLQQPLGRQLLHALALGPGDSVLDLGCGTAELSVDALRLVQPTGSITAIDPLRTRIEVARRLHPHLPGLELRHEGAEALVRHPDDRYDAAYLNDVLQWLPAPDATLREIHRILKPHGRLGLQGSFLESCTPFLGEPPFKAHAAEFPGARRWLDIEAALASIGFRQTALALGRSRLRFADANAALAFMEASSFNNWLGHLPPSLRTLARQRQLLELERKRTAEGLHLETTSIQVVAVKPPPGPEALFRWWDLPLRRSMRLAPGLIWEASFRRIPDKKAPSAAAERALATG